MRKYFIVKDNNKLGPLTLDGLKDIDFDKNTLVWHSELEDWTKAENVNELIELLKETPPPIPTQTPTDIHQKIKIDSPVDVIVSKKKNKTKEEVANQQRANLKVFFTEVGNLLMYGLVSIIISFFFYSIYVQSNQPDLITDQAQKQFNIEYQKKSDENYGNFYFGTIYNKYLGYYKYDDHLSLYDIKNVNDARVSILEEITKEISTYIFLAIFGILIIQRYLRLFIKWYKPKKDNNYDNKNE